jgi:hypothetical protein
MMSSSWVLRGSLIALLFGLIAAPTPGAVGSCGDSDLSKPVNFTYYCRTREELTCVRRFLRKEITARERDQCRWDAVDACARRSFPYDCQPTKRIAEGCLNALRSFDTLDTTEDRIKECATDALCRATPQETPDAGELGP